MASFRPSLGLLFLAFAALLLAGLHTCDSAAHKARVRKELRTLSSTEYKLFMQGMSTMLSVSTAAGQQIFGKRYKEYDYFIVKHAVATKDPRGDMGHNGPHFMTFHRAFLLELEQALLTVVPSLKAIPYFDFALDMSQGKYYNTSKSMFSNKYAGAFDCSSGTEHNCQVLDGVFARKPVSFFNNQTYGQYAAIYNGSAATGQLRDPTNANTNRYVTRFPLKNLFYPLDISWSPALALWINNRTGVSAGFRFNFTSADFERCLAATAFSSWLEWSYCIDTGFVLSGEQNSAAFDKYTNNTSPMLHPGMHFLAGGTSDSGVDGDMKDVTTSPNEVLLFMTHHANVDRNCMSWQVNAQKLNATMGSRAVLWRFPASAADYAFGHTGTYLHDVISSHFPYTDLFSGSARPATNFDLLDKVRPGAIYTYDSLK